jgi:hypothetical protein
MPFNSYGALNPSTAFGIIFDARESDVLTINQIETGKLMGRWRNTGANARPVPTTTPTVERGDAQGDILYNGTQLHICLDINGLTWRTITLAVV